MRYHTKIHTESKQMQRVQIPQSHNPTHAHPQWRETARAHRMQKVIHPSWKPEHSYANSHWGEYPLSATSHSHKLENWRSIHRQCHCQWGKVLVSSQTTECNKSLSKAGTLGRHLPMYILGRSPTLVPSMKNHWSKWNYEEPYSHSQWGEVAQMQRV